MENGEEYRLTSGEQRLAGTAWRAAMVARETDSPRADYLEGYSNGIQDAVLLHNGLERSNTSFTIDAENRVRLFKKSPPPAEA